MLLGHVVVLGVSHKLSVKEDGFIRTLNKLLSPEQRITFLCSPLVLHWVQKSDAMLAAETIRVRPALDLGNSNQTRCSLGVMLQKNASVVLVLLVELVIVEEERFEGTVGARETLGHRKANDDLLSIGGDTDENFLACALARKHLHLDTDASTAQRIVPKVEDVWWTELGVAADPGLAFGGDEIGELQIVRQSVLLALLGGGGECGSLLLGFPRFALLDAGFGLEGSGDGIKRKVVAQRRHAVIRIVLTVAVFRRFVRAVLVDSGEIRLGLHHCNNDAKEREWMSESRNTNKTKRHAESTCSSILCSDALRSASSSGNEGSESQSRGCAQHAW